MRFRQGVFQFERFPGCCLRLGRSLSRNLTTEEGEKRIGIGQSGRYERVIWIFANRLLEVIDGGSQVRPGAFVRKKCAFEIKLMCLSVLRWPGCNRALLG